MGGAVPQGYEARSKKLVINPDEGKIVRRIFRLYLEVGSVRLLKERLDDLGLMTRVRGQAGGSIAGDISISGPESVPSSGQGSRRIPGGRPFTRGHLHWLLTNPIYVGDIRHKDQIVIGQHEAIIDRDLWDAVQTALKGQANPRSRSSNLAGGSLFGGVLFDETGDRLTPSHAVKDGRRYRYYISQRVMQARKRDASGWRLPAEELEAKILSAMRNLLADHQQLGRLIGVEGRDAGEIRTAVDHGANLGLTLTVPINQASAEAQVTERFWCCKTTCADAGGRPSQILK